jgi:hypothetical protein
VETPEPGGIFLRVQTPAYQLTARGVQIDGDSRFVRNDQPGAPALPVWRTVVELPASGGWELSYDSPGAQVLAQPVQQPATPVPDSGAAGQGAWRGSRCSCPAPCLW